MSRSRKKTAKAGWTTSTSDKKGKRQANRAFRRAIKQTDKDADIFPELREISDVWDFPKDGEQRIKNPTEKDFRK